MEIFSVDINFGVAQPSKGPKPTKVEGKGNQEFDRREEEL